MKQFDVLDGAGNHLAIIQAEDEAAALASAKDLIIGAESVAEHEAVPDATPPDEKAKAEIVKLNKEIEALKAENERLAKGSPELSSAGNAVKLFSMWLGRRASSLGVGKLQPNSDRNMAYLAEVFANHMGLELPDSKAVEEVFQSVVVEKSKISMD